MMSVMATAEQVRKVSRRLRDLVEPIAANVYFCPEAQEQYKALGVESYVASYFCSRGGCMGQVPGEVVVAAFGVFNPALVIPAVDEGWSQTDAPSILEARRRGATAALERILGGVPEGARGASELRRRGGGAGAVEGRALS